MTRYPEGAVPALEHQRMGMPPPMTETIYCQEPQYIMQTVPVTQQIRKIVRPPVRFETVEQTIWEPRTVQIVTYKEVSQFRQVDVEKVGRPDTVYILMAITVCHATTRARHAQARAHAVCVCVCVEP